MGEAHKNVRVLLVTMALQGHMNPMLKFAHRLALKGLHVTLATTEAARHRMPMIETLKSEDRAAGTLMHLEFFSDGLSPNFDRDKHGDIFFESLSTVGAKNLSYLITELASKGMRFSCIVYNSFLPWVASIASDQGIPCAVLWIQAWSVFSIYYHYYANPHYFVDMEKGPDGIIELPGVPPVAVKDLPSFISPSSPHPHLTKLVQDFVRSLAKVKWILGNSFDELEDTSFLLSINSQYSIRSVGPLVSPAMLGQEEIMEANKGNVESTYCMEWLDQQPPSSVVYISFGSLVVLSRSQIESIATGLKNSSRRFLWVVRLPEEALEATESIVGHQLPPEFMEETSGRGLVVAWSPQEAVLTHPATACFMTHCGWNSTIETIVAGIPIIAAPKWSDQPLNAKLLVEGLRVGVRLGNIGEDDVITARDVEDCIREVMEGPRASEMRNRAVELREAAQRASREWGTSDKNVDDFINEIIGK